MNKINLIIIKLFKTAKINIILFFNILNLFNMLNFLFFINILIYLIFYHNY
jgi:hypothetical protein